MYRDFQPEDWSHIEGNLVMTIMTSDGKQSFRCGAHIFSKKDVESVQLSSSLISDYGNLVQVDGDEYQEDPEYIYTRVASNTGEYDFINKIVQDIFHNIKPQGMEDNLIGMEFHMDALRSLLDTEETKEARVIGIWGMGGIVLGKMTCVLQEKILNDIQQIPRTKIKIRDCDNGLRLIKKAFFNKKVLLVLDDVDDIKQLEFLAASRKWFGQENRPPEGYEDLSLRGLHYTGYLPLAKEPNIEIFETLKLSFDGLQVSEKQIFLDIACFFKGKEKEHVTRILDSFGFKVVIGISALIKKSLITVSNAKLDMHDLIQEMGLKIAHESFFQSRLWELEDTHDVINMNRILPNLKFVDVSRQLVYLNMSGCKYLTNLPSMIEMESLETLILSGCFSLARFPVVSPLMVKLSKVYLDGSSRIEELASSISHLSVLSLLNLMSCNNIKYIPTSICELRHLKSLYLHNCTNLQKLPEELGSMESLEELLLGLPEMYNYERLPPLIHFQSLKILCSLRRLDLSWRQIDEESFPRNLGEFFSLEELYLSGNCKLTHLPAGISQLSHLKLLEVSECSKLRVLNALPSVQLSSTLISDYGNLVQVDGDEYQEDPEYIYTRVASNTYVYEEKVDDKTLNLVTLRNKMSRMNIMNRTVCMSTMSSAGPSENEEGFVSSMLGFQPEPEPYPSFDELSKSGTELPFPYYLYENLF
nr:hypothetical protein [Tanacetum cinerariifolium]